MKSRVKMIKRTKTVSKRFLYFIKFGFEIRKCDYNAISV